MVIGVSVGITVKVGVSDVGFERVAGMVDVTVSGGVGVVSAQPANQSNEKTSKGNNLVNSIGVLMVVLDED